MDVLAQAMGYMVAEDLANEMDDLATQLWAERGRQHTDTSRKADERLLAIEDLRNRPETDLTPEEREARVMRLPSGRGRKALTGDSEMGG